MNVKVSVTVPIFNAEKFLFQTLDSLSKQTLKEIEFILVDDGSYDKSRLICSRFVESDSRFRIISHDVNKGSASARQTGLDASKGEYVIVCDADDWVEPTIYEWLYKNAKKNNADISTCDYYVNYDNGVQKVCVNSNLPSTEDEKLRAVLMRRIPPASWIKLVRRKFITDNGINYEKGINMGEDYLILVKMMLCNPSVVKINIPLYHYRRVYSGHSYTNSPTYSVFKQSELVFKWFLRNIDNTMYGKELFCCAIDIAYLGLRINDMPRKEHKDFMRKYCKFSSFVEYRCYSVKSMLVLMSKVFRPVAQFIQKNFRYYFYR